MPPRRARNRQGGAAEIQINFRHRLTRVERARQTNSRDMLDRFEKVRDAYVLTLSSGCLGNPGV